MGLVGVGWTQDRTARVRRACRQAFEKAEAGCVDTTGYKTGRLALHLRRGMELRF